MLSSLTMLFTRDLDKLTSEIAAYKSESLLWKIDKDIANCAGNLCLHLCGNLQHFIGHVFGKNGYVRDREAEFASKNIPREELLDMIETTKSVITQVLPGLDEAMLDKDDIKAFTNHDLNNGQFLLALYGHLNYHLGQINYHRRLLST